MQLNDILTYDPETGQTAFVPYTERTVHTKHGKMYKIKTKRGYQIKVTDDHSLLTNGGEDFFEKLPPEKALGKFVPVLYSVNSNIEIDNTDFITDQVASEKNKGKYLISVDYQNNIERSKILLWAASFRWVIDKITDSTVFIDTNGKRVLPQENTLVDENTVAEKNPANPYLNIGFNWDEVIEVTEIPREEITYDFSVDSPCPYFLANEILVFDTVMVHTPVSAEARQEALDKMLPSKNLFQPRTLQPMLLPRQEHIFGFFLCSKDIPELRKSNVKAENVTDVDRLLQEIKMGNIKPDKPVKYQGQITTAGIAIAMSNLPLMLRDYNMVWTKPNIRRVMDMLAKQEPGKYGYVVNLFKDLGGLYAYKLGATFKMSDFDLQKLKKMRDAYFAKTDKALAKIEKSNLAKVEKEKKIGEELRKAQTFASSLMEQQTGNTFNKLYSSGAKGSGGQVTQILSSPTVVADPKNRLIPTLIHHSYLEGLSPADYFTSSYGTRKGSVSAKLSVAPSGGLSKEILGNTLEVVISCKECGTRNGLKRNIDDKDNVLYRLEAGTNKFIDANYYEQLKRKGTKEVTVRSPATCQAKEGVCQHCFGFDTKMRFPDIGQNVGVEATHAVTEPMTQMGLSSKHTAGTASKDTVDFGTIKAFYNMSSKYSGSAVISEVAGKISKIEHAATGGMNVFVGSKKYYCPPGRTVKVTVGQQIEAGDPLTDGITPYSLVVPHKGIEKGRELFINEASKLYSSAGFGSIKKNLETISRGLINYVQIQDAGDFDGYAEGDIVDYNKLMADIRSHPGKKKPEFTPVQSGTNKNPLYKNDWLGSFGFKFLKQKLIDNAATFSKSPKHSYNPIGPYARGAGFGKGENGKY